MKNLDFACKRLWTAVTRFYPLVLLSPKRGDAALAACACLSFDANAGAAQPVRERSLMTASVCMDSAILHFN